MLVICHAKPVPSWDDEEVECQEFRIQSSSHPLLG